MDAADPMDESNTQVADGGERQPARTISRCSSHVTCVNRDRRGKIGGDGDAGASSADYPGAGTAATGRHIATTNYDPQGNVSSTLTAPNRELALDPAGLGDLDLNPC
jgi:hypothetical protein